MPTIERLSAARDEINAIRARYNRHEATYEDMRAAAIRLLQLRQDAEREKFGAVKTKINAVTIAQLLR